MESANPAPIREVARDAAEVDRVETQWFALEVTARHEKAVARMLHHKGYETLRPLYTKRHQYANRAGEFELPLFPGYVFCRFEANARLPVLTTPGVLRLAGAGRTPVAVDSAEIAALHTAVRAKARMTPWPFWKSGQRGRVVSGPLAGIEGIVATVKESVRMVLSVSLLAAIVAGGSGCGLCSPVVRRNDEAHRDDRVGGGVRARSAGAGKEADSGAHADCSGIRSRSRRLGENLGARV